MTLGDITVNNPKVALYPATIFGNDPDMILGMDVLRKLHIYFAFREGKMYITPASVQTPEQQAMQITLEPTAGLQTCISFRQQPRSQSWTRYLPPIPMTVQFAEQPLLYPGNHQGGPGRRAGRLRPIPEAEAGRSPDSR